MIAGLVPVTSIFMLTFKEVGMNDFWLGVGLGAALTVILFNVLVYGFGMPV